MTTPPVPLDALPLPPVAGLRHVLSTRHGGVSAGPYATLNLGAHVGDDAACVAENRRRLAGAAGYPADALVSARQVHGTRLARVTAADRGRGALDWIGAIPDTDGLLVAEPDTPVAILVADCAPVLIVDPVRRALALVHAGWRGALGRIASAAVRALAADHGSRPNDLLASLGPTLCPACLEIGPTVADAVAAEFGDAVLEHHATPHLRLHALLTADLTTAGLPHAHITAHPVCTRCHTDRFFSHRGQAGVAGRFGVVAWWDCEK